jgi:two-component system alkaline phosphatase synthesis response regulator PhoP
MQRSKMRVLVVEDDEVTARVLYDNLTFEGFHVLQAATGAAALKLAETSPPDVVLLDVTLPDMSGFDLCSPLRRAGATPIIFLTARGQKVDKLRGLNLGADDYVTKPFDLEELLLRVHAILRRSRITIESLTLGSIVIDFRRRQATRGRHRIHLTQREFDVLQFLAERQGRVVTRDDLLREIWGYLDRPITRSVDFAVARLRKKIEPDPHHPRFLRSAHGDGYCLTASETPGESSV